MNNGANIKFFGTSSLFVVSGDIVTTGRDNLTELQRTYCIRKDKIKDGYSRLQSGKRAEGYTNLYLFNPPTVRKTETHAYFSCVFYGILGTTEGGKGSSYETPEDFTNVLDNPLYFIALPAKRFLYSIPRGSEDRSSSRQISLPSRIKYVNRVSGKNIYVTSEYLFWSLINVEKTNFGKYDSIRESWQLNVKYDAIFVEAN